MFSIKPKFGGTKSSGNCSYNSEGAFGSSGGVQGLSEDESQ